MEISKFYLFSNVDLILIPMKTQCIRNANLEFLLLQAYLKYIPET